MADDSRSADNTRSGAIFLTQVVAFLGAFAVFGLPLILVGAVSFARIFQSSPYNLDAATSWQAVGMIPSPDLVVHALDVMIEPYAAKAVAVLATRSIIAVVAIILFLAAPSLLDGDIIRWKLFGYLIVAGIAFVLLISAVDPPAFLVQLLGIGPYMKVVQGLPSLAFLLYWGFMAGGAVFLTRLVLGVLSDPISVPRAFFRGKFFRNAFWATTCAYGAFLVPVIDLPKQTGDLLAPVTVGCHAAHRLSGGLLGHTDQYWHLLIPGRRLIVSIQDDDSGGVVIAPSTTRPPCVP